MTVPQDQRNEFVASYPEWELRGEELHSTFVLRDFGEAIGFVAQVALAAEKADHHPDIDIRWNKVTLVLTTHEAGGLTEKDTALASIISGFAGS